MIDHSSGFEQCFDFLMDIFTTNYLSSLTIILHCNARTLLLLEFTTLCIVLPCANGHVAE